MVPRLQPLLRISRFWNLLIIAVAQYFTVAFLVEPRLLLDWHLAVLSVATTIIAAAGYIINDYYDVKIDLINKPERVIVGRGVSRRYAILLHSALSTIGILLGLVLNWKIGVMTFVSVFMLWLYSNTLKRMPFVGNFVVALLTGGAIAILWLLYPFAGKTTLAIYTLFAFFMTLVREIIKDMEDLKGDHTFGCKTLPIVWGLRRTKNLIYLLTFIFVASVFLIHGLVEPLPMLYFSAFLFAPVAWLMIRLVRADTKKDFYQLSQLCKVIMVLGIFSMALIR
ncbi:MAG: geranylgeranylglycerol-phosphate geranylgeranyltransferase [Bacteroidota bacterium]